MYAERSDKSAQVASLRTTASRKLIHALREPEAPKSASDHLLLQLSGGSDGGGSPATGGESASIWSSYMAPSIRSTRLNKTLVGRSPGKGADKTGSEGGATLAERAAVQGRKMVRLFHLELARGWSTWVAFCEESTYMREQVYNALLIIKGHEMIPALRTWAEWYEERLRLVSLLLSASQRVAHLEELRVINAWRALVEARQRERVAMGAVAQIRKPKLVAAMRFWMADAWGEANHRVMQARLPAAPAGGGHGQMHGLCRALERCVQQRR